jgi:hypothetical protein
MRPCGLDAGLGISMSRPFEIAAASATAARCRGRPTPPGAPFTRTEDLHRIIQQGPGGFGAGHIDSGHRLRAR